MADTGRLLVIANETVGGDDLVDEVRRRVEGGTGAVHVVVPGGEALDDPSQDHQVVGGGPTGAATGFGDPQVRDHDQTSGTTDTPSGGLASAHGEDLSEREQARIILEHVLSRLEGVTDEVTGEVGPSDPVEAARAAVASGRYDGVVLATVKAGASKLIGKDLPSEIEDAVDVPVSTVYGERTHPKDAE